MMMVQQHQPRLVALLLHLAQLATLFSSSLLYYCHTCTAEGITTQSKNKLSAHDHYTAQVDWLTSPQNNGYFSSKITYDNGAMYVTEHVAKDEVLMFIPSKILFTASYDGIHNNEHNEKEQGGFKGWNNEGFCNTVFKLAEEYNKGQDSFHYPFINYIFDERHVGDLPQTWSEEGKELLRYIAGQELFGSDDYDVAGSEHDEMCEDIETDVEIRAFEAMLRRSWDDIMIPLLDMINHRNPPYLNVDSNSPHSSSANPNDVYVVALRDIAPGEQLHNSYNQCTDCYYESEYAYNYVTHKLLRDYGFVEQYPQRWKLFDGYLKFGLEEVHPKLLPNSSSEEGQHDDDDNDEQELKLVWYEVPTDEDIEEEDYGTRLFGHLEKFKSISVHEIVQKLKLRPHEANTIIAFHNALVVMIKHLLWYFEERTKNGEVEIDVGGTTLAPITYGVGNKPLLAYTDPLGLFDYASEEDRMLAEGEEYEWVNFNPLTCSFEYYLNRYRMEILDDVTKESSEEFELFGTIKTYHQLMTFWQTPYGEYDDKDVCFKIEWDWESCQSNRPHYHELFVHYPAMWMPQAKRMMFLGGGDSMILHEMMKYKELELVVGLELDKGVVQASLVYFETLPHFDKDKVEWWFGDCKQSLQLLPKEYLQSFDLIVVDLHDKIITLLDVMKDVMPYSHPDHGIIIRNEDYGGGLSNPYALHNVEMYDTDVPVYGYQDFTMASNAVDFMSASTTLKLHEMVVPPLYFNPSAATKDDFNKGSLSMYNYRKADKFGTDTSGSSGGSVSPSASVMMVLELEQVGGEKMTTEHIGAALAAADISVSKTEMWLTGGDSTMYFLAEDGYVIARAFPQEQYCALDVMLWGNHDKIYSVEKQLALALDSGIKSSYRILSQGMIPKSESHPSETEELASQILNAGSGESEKAGEQECSAKGDCEAASMPIWQSHANIAMKGVLSSMTTHLGPSSEILVLCSEQSQECGALKVATDFSPTTSTTAIYSCPESEPIFSCEAKLRSTIRSIMKNGNEISLILIDPTTPQTSGESLYRILDRPYLRDKILSETVVAVDVAFYESKSLVSWGSNFLDKFRKQFFPFNPSFHAEILYEPTNNQSTGLRVNIYAANNNNFYSEFVKTVDGLAKVLGMSPDVRYVKNGMNNYIADFGEATHKFSRGSYDNSEAREQRKSSKSLGRQSLWQYEAKAPSTEYTISSVSSAFESINMKKGSYELHGAPIIGGGFVVFALFNDGDMTISYDGKSRLDVNLFTLNQEEEVHVKFEQHIFEHVPRLNMKLGDMQPRGTGKVVVFETDHYYQKMEAALKARK